MLLFRAIIAFGLATGLFACAAPSTDPAPAPAPVAAPVAAAPPTAPDPSAAGIDGLYVGTSTRFQADRRDCPHPSLLSIAVQNGQFDYPWNRYIDVQASILPDGTIQGSGPDITLTGHFDGSVLTGDVSNGACGLHFTAHRQT